MSKETYKKGANIALSKNEISIFSEDKQKMLYSTDALYFKLGVKRLDRKHFIKPVDVEELALNKTLQLDFKGRDAVLYTEGIIEGYNFNKGVFTRDEAKALFNEGCRQGTGKYSLKSFNDCVNQLKPLSLPASVTIENDEIIEVVW